jgi:hypothetical protein
VLAIVVVVAEAILRYWAPLPVVDELRFGDEKMIGSEEEPIEAAESVRVPPDATEMSVGADEADVMLPEVVSEMSPLVCVATETLLTTLPANNIEPAAATVSEAASNVVGLEKVTALGESSSVMLKAST